MMSTVNCHSRGNSTSFLPFTVLRIYSIMWSSIIIQDALFFVSIAITTIVLHPAAPQCESFQAIIVNHVRHTTSQRTGWSILSASASKKKRSKSSSSSSSNTQSSSLPNNSRGFGITKSTKSNEKSYTPDTSSIITEFINFLNEEECEGVDETCIGISQRNGLRGLYTKESFQIDEYILAIPVVSALEIIQTKQIGNETSTLPSDVDKAVAYLQKLKEQTDLYTKWERYINTLPTRDNNNFAPTIDFWDVNDPSFIELQTLLPVLVEESIQRRQEIQESSIQHNIDYNELLFTTWLLRSRIFTTIKKLTSNNEKQGRLDITTPKEQIEQRIFNIIGTDDIDNKNDEITLHRTFLIPYMDMLNHAPTDQSNAIIHIIEGSNDDESMFCIQATKRIPVGHEVLITYGTGYESTFDIFAKYGFFILDPSTKPYLIRYNPNDIGLIDWHSILTNTDTGAWLTQSSIEQDIDLLLKQYSEDDNRTKEQVLLLRIYLKQLYNKWKQQQQQRQDLATSDDNSNNNDAMSNNTTIQIEL